MDMKRVKFLKGDKFIFKNEYTTEKAMLCSISSSETMLICEHGNRWSDDRFDTQVTVDQILETGVPMGYKCFYCPEGWLGKQVPLVEEPPKILRKVEFVYQGDKVSWRKVDVYEENNTHIRGYDHTRGGFRSFLKSKVLDGKIIEVK